MARRKPKSAARKSTLASKKTAAFRRAPRRRYTDSERQRILETASREGLSGPKAAKRFGISLLTFYNWRKQVGSAGGRGQGRVASPPLMGNEQIAALVRHEVRARIAQLIPEIVASEVAGALGGQNGPRRRRHSRS